MHESLSLPDTVVLSLPSAAYYIPNFISPSEEQQIDNHIHKLPQTRWTVLTHRRLLSLPSALTGTARDTLLALPLPSYLSDAVLPRLKALGLFSESAHGAPNHVLVNEYRAGEGIMPHEDGPAYCPITATISLGGHTVLNIYKKKEDGEREASPTWRILQEPRSLLVTTGDMYKDTLHGIAEREIDEGLGPETVVNWDMLGDKMAYAAGSAKRDTRISLTYRDVLKVAKLGNAMRFMNKK